MMLKTSCGCMSLQTGSITLASLNIMSAIGSTILLTMAMANGSLTQPTGETALLVWFMVLGVDIYLIIMAIFAGLMIVGSVRRYPFYVFPWTALTFSSLIANMALNLAAAIIFAIFLTFQQFLAGVGYIGLSTSLQIYLWLIIYSHHHELMAEHYGGQNRLEEGRNFDQAMNTYHKVETPGDERNPSAPFNPLNRTLDPFTRMWTCLYKLKVSRKGPASISMDKTPLPIV